MSTITILGAGVMGSAMSVPARDRGHDVRLVGTHLDEEIVARLRADRVHSGLGVTLPKGVSAFTHDDFAGLAAGSDVILLGVSSAGMPWAVDRLCETLTAPAPVVMITKGLHGNGTTLGTLPDRVAGEVQRRTGLRLSVAAIAGPCIAGELAVRRQTGTVITSRDPELARRFCDLLETGYYHPRPSADLVGVELCAAFKNLFAIGVGWARGRRERLGATENQAANHNAAAMIFDQAIRELTYLVRALGGATESVWGMPGAGDLYVTCEAGRNSRLGHCLGRGMTFREAMAGPMRGATVEGAELGVAVAPALRALMARGDLESAALPLTRALLDVLTADVELQVPWADLHR